MSNKLFTRLSIATVAVLAGGQAANAGVILEFSGIDQVAGSFVWNYSVVLQPEFVLRPGPQQGAPGDFVTLYDVPGYVPSSASFVPATPPGGSYAVLVNNVGVTPPKVAPLDDPTLPNITVALLNGSPPIAPNPIGPALRLGTLSFASTFGVRTPTPDGYFASFDAVQSTGRNFSNVGLVELPLDTSGGPIPEPTALGLLAPATLLLARRKAR